DFKEITYNYFKDEPIVEMIESTYTQQKLTEKVESISWNHGLSEVLTALLNKGLTMTSFQEFDYSPYNIFSQLIEVESGKFQFQQFGNKIPLVYALKTSKAS
ncbi:MAG: SAM-dependent methyltransferase, partial [Moheibacter sp.]